MSLAAVSSSSGPFRTLSFVCSSSSSSSCSSSKVAVRHQRHDNEYEKATTVWIDSAYDRFRYDRFRTVTLVRFSWCYGSIRIWSFRICARYVTEKATTASTGT